jgi:hypothetical protein
MKGGKCALDSCYSGLQPVAGFCEYFNDVSDSLDRWEFPDQLSCYWLMKQDPLTWSSMLFSVD